MRVCAPEVHNHSVTVLFIAVTSYRIQADVAFLCIQTVVSTETLSVKCCGPELHGDRCTLQRVFVKLLLA